MLTWSDNLPTKLCSNHNTGRTSFDFMRIVVTKITVTKKPEKYQTWGILATIQFRTFICLSVYLSKNPKIKIMAYKTIFYPLFCMDVKLVSRLTGRHTEDV